MISPKKQNNSKPVPYEREPTVGYVITIISGNEIRQNVSLSRFNETNGDSSIRNWIVSRLMFVNLRWMGLITIIAIIYIWKKENESGACVQIGVIIFSALQKCWDNYNIPFLITLEGIISKIGSENQAQKIVYNLVRIIWFKLMVS